MSKRKIPRTVAGPKAEAAPEVPRTRREIIDETIEQAMRPYLGVLPPEGLQTMRDILEDAMTTHPAALEALAELDARPPDRSGTRPKGDRGSDA